VRRHWLVEVLGLESGEVLYRKGGLRRKDIATLINKALSGDLPPVEYPWETSIQVRPDASAASEHVGEGKRGEVELAWEQAALEALWGRSRDAVAQLNHSEEEVESMETTQEATP